MKTHKPLVPLVAAVLAVVVSGSGCSGSNPGGTNKPASDTSPAPTRADGQIGEGTWVVGKDIQPGVYEGVVPADSSGCYWERDKNADGNADSIIDNDTLDPGAHVLVQIAAGDYSFESDGCGTLTVYQAPAHPASSMGEGRFLVGKDIEAGTYRAVVPTDSPGCSWERLNSLTGGFASIIDNDDVEPGDHVVITVQASDKVVSVSGCGTLHLG